ncbi:hypothetical protein FQR65_LT01138 [Abscondita terminalis]|nr:hypothetical protein FQR65_LT01138 [Abscondita terminalis]
MKIVAVIVVFFYGIVAVPLRDADKVKSYEDTSVSTEAASNGLSTDIKCHKYLTPSESQAKFDQNDSKDISDASKYPKSLSDFSNDSSEDKNENKKIDENDNGTQTRERIDEKTRNCTDLSKKSEGLEFPDRIGTPAIISLQGPPGK